MVNFILKIIVFTFALKSIINNNQITITILIIGPENSKIISNNFRGINPTKMKINNEEIKNYSNEINLDQGDNNITIIWETAINSCKSLFQEVRNIKFIDLSEFDSSEITDISDMFLNCNGLESIDLTNFNTSKVTSMENTFNGCNALRALNVSGFDTSSVENMNSMFLFCRALTSLDLKNFNTKRVTRMEHIFSGCDKLENLDLSNFDTSSVTTMLHMFFTSYSLKYINMTNFDTSKVEDMTGMFEGCPNLESLNISNFNTSSVKKMHAMFAGCEKLTSLDIRNFNTSLVDSMNYMFKNCYKLNSLDLSNFDTSNVKDMSIMFLNCYSLTTLNITNFNMSSIEKINGMFQNCYSLKSINLPKINSPSIVNISEMFYNCSDLISLDLSEFNTSSIVNMNSMFFDCKSLKTLNINNIDTSSVINIGNMFQNCKSLISLDLHNLNLSKVENFLNIFDGVNNSLIYCINDILYNITLSLNASNNNCTYFCLLYPEHKIIKETNECVFKCSEHNTYKYEYNNECYESLPNYSISYSIGSSISSSISSTINENESELIEKSDFSLEELNITITNSLFDGYKINDDKNHTDLYGNDKDKDKTINKIKDGILNGSLDDIISNILGENKKDFILYDGNVIFQLTSTENQINNKNNNRSTINLKNCESKLKEYYNISQNDSLLIFKVDYYKEGALSPVIGYEIYHPIEKYNLNLSVCSNITINLNIPVTLNEDNLYKYDPKNEYYTDECRPSTTENGTDILLKDRQNEFNEKGMSVCEKNCSYNGYNNRNVECECGVKYELLLISDLENKNDLFSYEFNDKNDMITIKCYKTLFTKDGLKSNIGSYILLFIILLFLVNIILFYKCGYIMLEEKIDKIYKLKINENYNNNSIKETEDIKSKHTKIIHKNKKKFKSKKM